MEASLTLFAFFVIVFVVISDIITVFFRLTGMTEEKARFQVVSLLTSSGFTTRESEAVLATHARRKLARITMIFGYVFTVTIVTTAVNFFMTLGRSELNSLAYLIPVIVLALFLLHVVRRSAFFKTKFDASIEKLGNRIIFGGDANPIVLMEDYGEIVVAHVQLRNVPEDLRGKTLAESGIRAKNNITVLMRKNRSGLAEQADADMVLQKNDIVMVLGRCRDIRAVFE